MHKEHYPHIYLYRRIVQAKLFIDTNFSAGIDLDRISDEAFFSKFHFIRLFKKIYSHTPHQYLTMVRVKEAQHLLRTGASVSDTCFSVGFDSVTSFTALFKRTNQLTPSAYRRQELARLAQTRDKPLNFIPHCFAESKGWTKNSNFEEVIP